MLFTPITVELIAALTPVCCCIVSDPDWASVTLGITLCKRCAGQSVMKLFTATQFHTHTLSTAVVLNPYFYYFARKFDIYVVMFCRHTSVTGFVQGPIAANGQQGVEAVDNTGKIYAAEA